MPLYGQAAAGHQRLYADRASFDVSYITASVWIRWRSLAASCSPVIRGTSTSAAGYWGFRLDASSNRGFQARIGAATVGATGATNPPLGVWEHWVGLIDSSNDDAYLFVNGAQEATNTGTGTLAAAATSITLFQRGDNTAHADVELADLNCWNVTLSLAEITALYAGTPAMYIQPNNLFLSDALDWGSVDRIGMEAGADTGNIQRVPLWVPYTNNRRDKMASRFLAGREPRGGVRKRRQVVATPPPVSGPLIGPGRLCRIDG